MAIFGGGGDSGEIKRGTLKDLRFSVIESIQNVGSSRAYYIQITILGTGSI